jgi:hypothetical protein
LRQTLGAINFIMTTLREFETALILIIALIVVVINYAKRRYELNKINSDHIIITRLLMAERPLYKEDISKITLKELPKDRAKLIIYSRDKVFNFRRMDIRDYSNLVEFSKNNSLPFYLEDKNGIKTIING